MDSLDTDLHGYGLLLLLHVLKLFHKPALLVLCSLENTWSETYCIALGPAYLLPGLEGSYVRRLILLLSLRAKTRQPTVSLPAHRARLAQLVLRYTVSAVQTSPIYAQTLNVSSARRA